MNIEISPAIECGDEIVISCWVGSYIGEAHIGKKKFIEIGKFEYEWSLEYLSREDLLALAEALVFAADHMMAEPEGEVSA